MTTQQANAVSTVRSKDGTSIAFERFGDGRRPPLILVLGAFNERSTGVPLATFLQKSFTVYAYDRRGRGDSGDTLPYAIEREVEDLAAMIAEGGGSAYVMGYSSGALLALEASASGLAITRLALYEPPFNAEARPAADHAAQLSELIAAGRRGDAVEYFQGQIVGIPMDLIVQFRNAPFRGALEAMAHTLVYEATILADSTLPTAMAALSVPTLVVAGELSPTPLRAAGQAVADAVLGAKYRTLPGQTHDIVPEALGPALIEFMR